MERILLALIDEMANHDVYLENFEAVNRRKPRQRSINVYYISILFYKTVATFAAELGPRALVAAEKGACSGIPNNFLKDS